MYFVPANSFSQPLLVSPHYLRAALTMTATGMVTTAAVITVITAAGMAAGAAGDQDMASALIAAGAVVHAVADRVVADDRAAVVDDQAEADRAVAVDDQVEGDRAAVTLVVEVMAEGEVMVAEAAGAVTDR